MTAGGGRAGCARAAAETRSESGGGGGGGRKEQGDGAAGEAPGESSHGWGSCHRSGGLVQAACGRCGFTTLRRGDPRLGGGSCKTALRGRPPSFPASAGTPHPFPPSPFGAPFLAEERIYQAGEAAGSAPQQRSSGP